LYQNPFYIFIKTLDEIKGKLPQDIPKYIPKKKKSLKAAPCMCLHPWTCMDSFMVTLKNPNSSKRFPPQLTIPKNVVKLGLLGFNNPLLIKHIG
jgi:hypothetical protein